MHNEPLYYEVLPKNLKMFGGGSGGSSGESGAKDYPEYMKTWHQTMLADVYYLYKSASRNPFPEAALYDPKVWFGLPDGNSAYAALSTYRAVDIDALLASVMANDDFILPQADIAAIKAKAAALREELISIAPYGTAVDDLIDAHSTKLLQKVNDTVIPKIEIGMRDVNAVIGSSFVIAKELAMEDYTSEISEFSAKVRIRFWELRHELYKFTEELWIHNSLLSSELALKYTGIKAEKEKLLATMSMEAANYAVLAQSKYGVVTTEKEIRNRTWQLDLYEHMSKTLASISGASPVSSGHQKSSGDMFTGVIGGAAAGAAAGSMVMPGWGTAIGAVVGGIGGLLK